MTDLASNTVASGTPGGVWLGLDERGIGVRATWRPVHGFVNLSLWHEDVCVATFHLSPHQMGELVAFLGSSLSMAVDERSHLQAADDEALSPRPSPVVQVQGEVEGAT